MLSILPPALFASFSMAVRRPEPPSLSRPLVPSAVYDPTIMNLGMFRSPFEHAVRPSRGVCRSACDRLAPPCAPPNLSRWLCRRGSVNISHAMKSLLAMAVLWLGACAGGQAQRRDELVAWQAKYPDAAQELCLFARDYPIAAVRVRQWLRRHPTQAREPVAWGARPPRLTPL